MDFRKMCQLLLLPAALLCCLVAPLCATERDDTLRVDANSEDFIDLSAFGERMYGEPDVATGKLLATYSKYGTQNPEELGSYLEGDILVPRDHKLSYRNGMLAYSARWPGAVVPYEIRGRFSSQELAVIGHAFQEYHTKTCVRFRPRSTERDYIIIMSNSTGCWSSVGRLGGRQVVNLQTPSCFRSYGTTMHELMHALGFFHEQSRHERDEYIRVLSENVKSGMMLNFQKVSPRVQYGFGVPYDYASVMHYSATSFSKNGEPTIVALKETKEAQLIGQRYGFSKGDVQKINAMYRCK